MPDYSTAEALAQFALELDAQKQVPSEEISDIQGNPARAVNGPPEPVFSRETRDLIVIEAARILIADGLNIRGE